MDLAPLPATADTTNQNWLALFDAYRHVITPLRALGLPTTIETSGGNDVTIVSTLQDGSYLSIGSEGPLPQNPADVKSWTVHRGWDDAPGRAWVYDSGNQDADGPHGAAIAPMLGRIVHWLLAGRRAVQEGVPDRLGALLAATQPQCAPGPPAAETADAIDRLVDAGLLLGVERIENGPRMVFVTVQPATIEDWHAWQDLIGCPRGEVSSHSASRFALSLGEWQATPIRLQGYGVPSLLKQHGGAR
ncbi:hypothetical protein ACIQXD_29525 [Streptomyces uncialis]|uniref:hypothetical protein n=1 Tax=Streptomyces uncialis TaxID=1048205 RepID=UPI0038302D78